VKLLSTLAYLCISNFHCCCVKMVEIRHTQQSTLWFFSAHFQHEINQSQRICNLYFTEQFTLLATLSSDSIHGNYRGNSISVCVCSCFFFSLYLFLISNLHLTPSWGKASHSSTVFVPVTSRAPPAYQYQLRQC